MRSDRDRLLDIVHDYFRVDEDEVWMTVERDLPPLKAALEKLLGDLLP